MNRVQQVVEVGGDKGRVGGGLMGMFGVGLGGKGMGIRRERGRGRVGVVN